MFKDPKVLQKILDNTKPEYRDELKRVLDKLADEWHNLSDREKIQFAVDGIVEFIYDYHEDEWENFPEDLSELAVEGGLDWYYEDGDPDQETVSELILSYIVPDEEYIDPDNWYDTEWNENDEAEEKQSELPQQYSQIVITVDNSLYNVDEVKDLIHKHLEEKGIKNHGIWTQSLKH